MLTTKQGMYTAEAGELWYDSATVSTPETTTFTVPSGIFLITAQMRGGGGRGGGVNITSGGGGGGGAYLKVEIPVSPFEILDLTIGASSGVTKISRGATVLAQCNGGASGNPNGATAAGGTFSTDASVTVLASANGGTGTASPDSCTPGHGGEGGGGGGISYCNLPGGNGGSGGVFGRGGNASSYGPGGTPGATGTDSPGYPGSANAVQWAYGGYGAPGLMKISW